MDLKNTSRNLKEEHLTRGILLSHSHGGLSCVYCVLFLNDGETGKGGHQAVGRLVKSPLASFSRLTGSSGYLTAHLERDYHAMVRFRGEAFLKVYGGGDQATIAAQLNARHALDKAKNQQRLVAVIETVGFCGRLNLPLRGHRDSGPITIDQRPSTEQGILRNLIYER